MLSKVSTATVLLLALVLAVPARAQTGPISPTVPSSQTVPASQTGQVPPPVATPQSDQPELRREFDQLFRRLLDNPADLQLNLRFIEVASRLGDLEAAIGALERLLFYNPQDPRLNLELGLLYFRLGSYATAQSYLETVLTLPGADPEQRQRAQLFLSELATRQSPSATTVFVQTGARYQTNATAGPDGTLVRAFGRDEFLNNEFARAEDWNAFGLASVTHSYAFEGGVLETGFAAYLAEQDRIDRLDLGLAEIVTGPRFAILSEVLSGVSVKPFALANGVMLGDDPYLGAFGGGVTMRVPVGTFATFDPAFEYRNRNYSNSEDYLRAEEQSGDLYSAVLPGTGAVTKEVRWFSRLIFSHNDAVTGFNSYDQVLYDLLLPITFTPFRTAEARPWVLTPLAGIGWTRYEDPDPSVDPGTTREDFEYRVGARLDVPLGDKVGFGILVQHQVNESNLVNFEFENTSVSFGPTFRF